MFWVVPAHRAARACLRAIRRKRKVAYIPPRWALVAGYSHDYLWILARERQLPPGVLEDLLAKAGNAGFATDALIFPGGAAP